MTTKAPSYRPSEMLATFKDLSFVVSSYKCSISVNTYRNNDGVHYSSPEKHGTQDGIDLKNALLGLNYKDVLTRAGGAVEYVGVFVGKGTPKAIIAVLTTFHDYHEKFIKTYSKAGGVRGKVAGWLADQKMDWEVTLQKITDEVIGLDCNGFVGNWLAAADHSLKMTPTTHQRDMHTLRKRSRKTVDQIQERDIIVWANMSHVAAIDSFVDRDLNKVRICQSAGGGPRINEYTIVPLGNGTYRLQGGIPKWDVPGPVLISSLWEQD